MSIDATDRAAVAHFLRVCGSGVVATIGADGAPQAAYVGLTATGDGADDITADITADITVVFDAAMDSRKVANITERPRVAVAVTGADTTVQLEGRARITRDEERWRLGEEYSRHFPGSRALDPGFAVIAVQVDWVRVYDAAAHPPHVTEASWAVT